VSLYATKVDFYEKLVTNQNETERGGERGKPGLESKIAMGGGWSGLKVQL
jgi:hypothetical protein